MPKYRVLAVIVIGVIGGASLAGASASGFRAHAAKTTTIKYFFKTTSARFTSPSGRPLSGKKAPAAGDHFLTTVNAYPGNHAHHTKTWTATASLYCTLTKVANKTNAPSRCEGIVAIGGSTLISISTQNLFGSNAVYPITGGTGKYLHARGAVKTKNVGNNGNADAVITIKG